jgi:hypothetical protein
MQRCGCPDGQMSPQKKSPTPPRTRRKLRSLSAAASGDHLHFLRPQGPRPPSQRQAPPLESRLPHAPTLIVSTSVFLSPPPAARDGEGITRVLYFAPTSRLLAPRCPVHGVLRSATSKPRLPIEVVIEFLNVPDTVVTAH